MNFKSFADLARDIRTWTPRLPREVSMVVGVPRSGLLAANIVALYLDLPLTDVDGLVAGRSFQTGRRYGGRGGQSPLETKGIALVVDDSVSSGSQMRQVQTRLRAANLPYEIRYAAVYAAPGSQGFVDHFLEIVPHERCFEWNVMHHAGLRSWCVDIDGILCRDPLPEENDDAEAYQRFLSTAEPIYVPTKRIGWLVTCRLEKYRRLTEKWLADHRIEYDELIMLQLPNKDARIRAACHASFKARAYESTDAGLFVESSHSQATEIMRLTGKEVLVLGGEAALIRPAEVTRVFHKGRRLARNALLNPKKAWSMVKRLASLAAKGPGR
jgi:orotate phosphoribosyltransferase